MLFWVPFPYSSRQNGETFIKHLVSSDFISATYSFGAQSTSSCVTTAGHLCKESFELELQACLQSSQRCHGGSFTSLVSRVNQKRGSGEVAITASKFISRSKERTVQNKHTLHFFAALGGLRKNKRQGWSKSYSHRITHYTGPGHTHTYSYSGGIGETLHEYILAYTMLIH